VLTIKIINDGTGTQESANYDYFVYVNGWKIASGHVNGHNRADGWQELLRMIAEQENVNEDHS